MATKTAKKPTKQPTKKAAKKPADTTAAQDGMLAAGSLLITYVAASWAIDSGSLWGYLIAYVGLYYGVLNSVRFVRKQFFHKDDKQRKAR